MYVHLCLFIFAAVVGPFNSSTGMYLFKNGMKQSIKLLICHVAYRSWYAKSGILCSK